MPFEHTYPGQPLRIKSQDWNGAMDAARAVVSGETGLRASVPVGGLPGGIIIAKNGTGDDIDRFAIVNLDEVVFTADDNESGYKNGPTLIATGPPIAGRLAFCGVAQEPIADGKTGRFAVSGLTVCSVSGTGLYAWPIASTSTHMETRSSGGYPVFDKGTPVDGISLATVLLSPLTNSGDGESAAVARGRGCACGECFPGTPVLDGDSFADICGCKNVKRIAMHPVLTVRFPDTEDDIEWTQSGGDHLYRYNGDGVWTTAYFDGPTCVIPGEGEDPDTEEHDRYRYVMTITLASGVVSGTVTLEPEDPEALLCPLVEYNWCLSDVTCKFRCLCPWTFVAAQPFSNAYSADACALCVQPAAKPTTYTSTSCDPSWFENGGAGCIFRLPSDIFVELSGVGSLEVVEPTYLLSVDRVWEAGRAGSALNCDWSVWPDIPLTPATCQNWRANEDRDLYSADRLAFVGVGILAMDENPSTFYAVVALQVGYTSADCYAVWASDKIECDAMQDTLLLDELTLSPVWIHEDLPQDARARIFWNSKPGAISSGHIGDPTCGARTACDETTCIIEVEEISPGNHQWVKATESTCNPDDCGNDCGIPCGQEIIHPDFGDANDYPPGTQFDLGSCYPPADVDYVEISLTPGVGCECSALSKRICLAGDLRYTGELSICGEASQEISYYYDSNDSLWHLDIFWASGTSATPEGPFNVEYSGCPGLTGTVTIP